MGYHDGAHGRVFRGMRAAGRLPDTKQSNDNVHHLAHRQVMPSHNTNGDRPVMHIPEGFSAQKAQADDTSNNANDDSDVETVYEQVFKTLAPTFDGPPQFFTTMEPTTSTSVQPAAEATTAAANSRKGNDDDQDQTPSREPVAQPTAASSSPATSSATRTPSTSSAAQQAVVSSSKPSSASSSTEITSSSIETGQVTYSHGAKAADTTSSMIGGTPLSATHSAVAEPQETGMTSGAKAGLAMGIIFGLALVFGLVFFCWRRKKSQRGLEEFNEKNGFAAAPAPVNRFSSDSDRLRRTSTQTSATAPRLSLRPVTQFLPNLTSGAAAPKTTQNPFGDAAVVSEKGHERTESEASDSNRSVESATTATTGTAQVVTAAAVPVARGPNNVHRVQLEFKPSMEDELELKSGQLVRMLHEYDDGWVSKSFDTYLLRTHTNIIPRHSAQRWIAARRVLSHAPVFPKCPSSLVARHLKTAPHPTDPTAWLHRPLSLTAPWLLAHLLPISQLNRAAHVLQPLKVSRHASPCQARLFR